MFLPRCVHAGACVCHRVNVRWEDNFQASLLSFHSMSPGDWTRVIRLGNKCFYLPSRQPTSFASSRFLSSLTSHSASQKTTTVFILFWQKFKLCKGNFFKKVVRIYCSSFHSYILVRSMNMCSLHIYGCWS